MSKRHLKAIAAPKSWPIKRKEHVYIMRPNPGTHKFEESMPIALILKLLNQIKTTREAKYLINQRKISVNGKPVKELKFPAGLFDVVSFSDKFFRILYNKRGKLIFKEINKSEADNLLYRIRDKTKLKNNKLQLNFYNGANIIVDKDEYNTNDVLVISDMKIKEKVPFEKNSMVYIIKGKHLGNIAKIEEIHEKPPLNNLAKISIDKMKIDLPKDYLFVIGKSSPIITLK
ncbi:30S ribosomal protein S4e [Candidatus Woesearchaeota archaeon]|nr:30S ribosomal protein S4e [Candidatus Woesearchaeota archaeon]